MSHGVVESGTFQIDLSTVTAQRRHMRRTSSLGEFPKYESQAQVKYNMQLQRSDKWRRGMRTLTLLSLKACNETLYNV